MDKLKQLVEILGSIPSPRVLLWLGVGLVIYFTIYGTGMTPLLIKTLGLQ